MGQSALAEQRVEELEACTVPADHEHPGALVEFSGEHDALLVAPGERPQWCVGAGALDIELVDV